MPTNRFQFSDDFVLNNGNVGINSSSPQEKLDVVGVVKGQDLKVIGVSSFTTYEGFLNSNQNIIENVSISNGSESGSLSGEIIVGTGITVSVSSGTTSSQGYIDSLKVYNTFTVPVGGTADRPSKSTPGQLFFNRDFATMEFWDGNVWRQVDYTTRSGRGVFGGGNYPNTIGQIEFISLSSGGTSTNFGNLSFGRNYNLGTAASSTRGLFAGGYTNTPATNTRSNVIDYITIASEGNSIDFGDRTVTTTEMCGCSSSTRGLFAGGFSTSNVIDYVQIATIGNALDFGDLSQARNQGGALASPTRGVFAGGRNPITNIIDYVTIASTGNATDFGDLTQTKTGTYGCCSNSIRGLIGGGYTSASALFNTIDFITIASTGNATVFGDLSLTSTFKATSSSTRGVFHQGATVDSVIISTTGNSTRFATLSRTWTDDGALSDSHGGLGGF
jgi:hypothetical protein